MDKNEQIFFSGAELMLADFGVVMLHTYIVSIDFRGELCRAESKADCIKAYYDAYISSCTDEERSIGKDVKDFSDKMTSFAARVLEMYNSAPDFKNMFDRISLYNREMRVMLPEVKQATIILAQFAKEWLV